MSDTKEHKIQHFSSQEIFDYEELAEIEDHFFSYYDEDTRNLVFEPRVYFQRYQKVFQLLLNKRWRKDVQVITEYGCGEFKLLKFFVHFLSLRKINFIDIDLSVLEDNLGHLNLCDYNYFLRRINPLQVNVFHGSISDVDERVLKSDVVIGIEIIEHLFPDTLEAIPFAIFGSVEPKIVIFTTPNADFNEALPNFNKVRHSDHKFEWTREQFESWSNNIVLRFPNYKVAFFGIGKGPAGTESLGCCSQLALFVRLDILNRENDSASCEKYIPMQPHGICTYLTHSCMLRNQKEADSQYYKQIFSRDYLYRDNDKGSDDEKLLEIMIRNITSSSSRSNRPSLIPLNKVVNTMTYGVLISEEEAELILTRHGFNVIKSWIQDDYGQNSGRLKRCVEFCSPSN